MAGENIRTGQPINLDSSRAEAQMEEILLEPQVLSNNLSTLIDRYAGIKTESGLTVAPDTVIEVDEGDSVTAFVGVGLDDLSRNIIFKREESTGEASEWIVISGLVDIVITDGSGRPIVSEADRRDVKSILKALKASYDLDVTENADNFDIRQHMIDSISNRIVAKEVEIASLKELLASVQDGDGTFDRFKIRILSNWRTEGEQSLDEEIGADSLSDAMRQAVKKFKDTNHRTDVQAEFPPVRVRVGEGVYEAIPSEVTLPLFKALSQYDNEAYVIQRVERARTRAQ